MVASIFLAKSGFDVIWPVSWEIQTWSGAGTHSLAGEIGKSGIAIACSSSSSDGRRFATGVPLEVSGHFREGKYHFLGIAL